MGLQSTHSMRGLLGLQRRQPINNLHRFQTRRNHLPNQLNNILRILCTVRVVNNTAPFI